MNTEKLRKLVERWRENAANWPGLSGTYGTLHSCADELTALLNEAEEAGPPHFDLHAFSAVNLRRCIDGFKHELASWSEAEWTNALAGEAGEAANFGKKLIRFRDGVAGNKNVTRDEIEAKLGRELADVVIYADLTAQRIGKDLSALIIETFNNKSDELGCPIKWPAAQAAHAAPAPAARGADGFTDFRNIITAMKDWSLGNLGTPSARFAVGVNADRLNTALDKHNAEVEQVAARITAEIEAEGLTSAPLDAEKVAAHWPQIIGKRVECSCGWQGQVNAHNIVRDAIHEWARHAAEKLEGRE